MIEACMLSDDGEFLQLLLDFGGRITQDLLEIAVAHFADVDKVAILLERGCKVDPPTLRQICRNCWVEAVVLVMDHVDQVMFNEEVSELIFEAAGALVDPVEKLTVLLDRAQGNGISQDAYWAAMASETRAGPSNIMRLLSKWRCSVEVTRELLTRVIKCLEWDIVLDFLNGVDIQGMELQLLETAASNPNCGGRLVRLIQERSNVMLDADTLLDAALKNRDDGLNIIRIDEENFGQITMTEEIMVKIVRSGGPSDLNLLSEAAKSLFDRTLITQRVIMGAMGVARTRSAGQTNHPEDRVENDIRRIVALNASHAISVEELKAAARTADTQSFIYLYNHRIDDSIAHVRTDLMREAGRNEEPYTRGILDFLLDQSQVSEIEEEVLLTLVAHGNPCSTISLCTTRSIALHVTNGVLKSAILTRAYELRHGEPLLATLLQYICPETIDIEELSKAAAFVGREDLLHVLSDVLGLTSPPSKWHNIACLYKAVGLNDTITIRSLIERGIEPRIRFEHQEFSDPLRAAVENNHEEAMRMVLAAGVDPDAFLGHYEATASLLCWAVWQDRINLVRILVDAGASLDPVDRYGRTAEILAEDKGYIRILRLLRQTRADRRHMVVHGGDNESLLCMVDLHDKTYEVAVLSDADGAMDTVDDYRPTNDIIAEQSDCTRGDHKQSMIEID